MTLLALFSGVGPKLKIAELDIEVCISEEHSQPVAVTQNPVEEGVDVTDHVQVLPETLTIRGLVSNTPVRFFSGVRSLLDLNNFDASGSFEGESRAFQAWSFLTDLRNEKKLLEIQTGFQFFESMMLTNLQRTRDKDSGNALTFTATFQEVVVVSSSFVALPKGFGAKTELGKTQKTAKSSSDNASILSNITGKR